MTVISPPESPPEVQRPYDEASTPRAFRVATYRRWTRIQQTAQVAIVAVGVAVTVLGGALTGVDWASSAGAPAALLVTLVAVGGVANALLERNGVRQQLAGAEPLPDGAIEVGARPLEPRLLLLGAGVGAVLTLLAHVLGASDIATIVAVIAGVCGGRVVSLEILLRGLVERAQPGRVYFVALDPDPAPWDPPLLWRPAAAA